MRIGKINRVITIYTLLSSVSGGDTLEEWNDGESARAQVEQIDGTRYLTVEQLVDREVYKITLWDNNYDSNIKVELGHYLTDDAGERLTNDAGERLDPAAAKALYPIRPVLRNPDRSMRNIVTIIMATKV